MTDRTPAPTQHEADLGMNAEKGRAPLVAWIILAAPFCAAIWLRFLPGLAADLFGWVANVARGFGMVAAALFGGLL